VPLRGKESRLPRRNAGLNIEKSRKQPKYFTRSFSVPARRPALTLTKLIDNARRSHNFRPRPRVKSKYGLKVYRAVRGK
jgi:hypothetical protein